MLLPVYLVGKDADGGEAVGRDTSNDVSNGGGGYPNGNGNGNGNGRHFNGNGAAPDVDEVRAEAARRAATELAAAALSASDGDTAAHSDDVDVLVEGICRAFGISGRERENVIAAARLHDIGKVAIPPQVLEKPGPLNDAEWAIMRRHTVVGQQILDAVPEMEEVARLVRHSHERWDGDGYPDGISDEEIPLGSRIVACADAFHAVRSDRAYRRGRDAEAALKEIKSCAGTQFDPDVVDALEVLVNETRAEMTPGNGVRTTYRSTRLAALLLALALGVGASAVAHFAGSPLAPKAQASGQPQIPLPAVGSPFDLPDLSDLALFDLGALRDRDAPNRTAQPAGRDRAAEVAPGQDRARAPGNPAPGDGVATPTTPPPDAGRDTGSPGSSLPQPGNQDQGNTGTPPAPPSNGNSGGDENLGGNGNSGGNGGTTTEPPTEPQGPAETPPGQTPGGNPGHGGLPPGNPLAPGHQPGGTPGHGGTNPSQGGTIVPGQAGTAPGQIQKNEREVLDNNSPA